MKSFNRKVQLPKYICYDNSCQLHKFCEKRNQTERSKFMDEKIYIIDRLHVQGHVEGCQKIYHPRLYPDINNCNSMICEQRNYWISGFKHSVKHMNQYRFNFFFYISFDYYNEIKSKGIINIDNSIDLEKIPAEKRKFALIDSDDDEI